MEGARGLDVDQRDDVRKAPGAAGGEENGYEEAAE